MGNYSPEYKKRSFDYVVQFLENCQSMEECEKGCKFLRDKCTNDLVDYDSPMPKELAGMPSNLNYGSFDELVTHRVFRGVSTKRLHAWANWKEEQAKKKEEGLLVTIKVTMATRKFQQSFYPARTEDQRLLRQQSREDGLAGMKEALAPYFTEHLKKPESANGKKYAL